MTRFQFSFLFLAAAVLGFIVLGAVALAWTSPTQNPPNGNVAAPLNEGATAQTKTGSFFSLATLGGAAVNATSSLCIAGDCKTAWSQVGGSQWTTQGNDIYYTAGSVSIGTTATSSQLHVFNSSGDNILKLSRGASTSTILRVGTDGALVVQNQSSDVLTIKSGNVGIGTTGPIAKLDIRGSAAGNPIILADRTFDGSRIQLSYNGVSAGRGEIGQVWSSAGATDIWIGSNLNSVGASHVTTPTQDSSLEESWVARFNSRADSFQVQRIAAGGGSSASTFLHINSTGNVGIGTTGPNTGGYTRALSIESASDTGLEIRSTRADADNVAAGYLAYDFETNSAGHKEIAVIQANTDGGTANQRGGQLIFRTKPNAATALTTRMVIRENGNVGIGTTGPGAQLQVGGVGSNIQIWGDGGGTNVNSNGKTMRVGTLDAFDMNFVTNASNVMTLKTGGNVGIGTTAPSLGKLVIQGSSGDTNLVIIGSGTGNNTRTMYYDQSTPNQVWVTGIWYPYGTNSYVVANGGGVGVALGSGNTSWSALSDERVKHIYGHIEDSLAKISKLRGVYYKFKNEDDALGRMRVGVIAQDVQLVLPEIVDRNEATGMLDVRYTELIPLLIGGIQDLTGMVASLGGRVRDTLASGVLELVRSSSGVFNWVEARYGVTTYDRATGKPYCIGVINGDIQAVAGAC